jgi:hypothetical protein
MHVQCSAGGEATQIPPLHTHTHTLTHTHTHTGVIPSAEPEGESERIALAKAVPAARADALALSAFAPSETRECVRACVWVRGRRETETIVND